RAIRPEAVEQELRETDPVLGHPQDVARFLAAAGQRLGFDFRQVSSPHPGVDVYRLSPQTLRQAVQLRLPPVPGPWLVTFASPTPEGLSYIGRNHPLVEGLSEYLLDRAFYPV